MENCPLIIPSSPYLERCEICLREFIYLYLSNKMSPFFLLHQIFINDLVRLFDTSNIYEMNCLNIMLIMGHNRVWLFKTNNVVS